MDKLYRILKPLTKQEILRLSHTSCKHGHPLLAHPKCLERHIGHKERVGFLDIETSNLNASFGVVVTWCIKESGGKILEGFLTKKDFQRKNGEYDKRIIKDCVDAILKFDRLVVYWGKDRRFDMPFLRTRAVGLGLYFPYYQERITNDLYDIVRNKFLFGRNSLHAACQHLGIGSKDTPLCPQLWMDATIGRKPKAIQTILQHNREDVISTELLWEKISSFANTPKTSI